jgi:tRNA-Thr(GGU) m(6)t(6)A37 methyltransferase TsaA
MTLEITPIGILHTSYKKISDMPIQPLAAEGKAYIELFPEYVEGLKDIEGFSHLTLLYNFHKVEGYKLSVTPFMDTVPHGIFATRSPKRPNAIGLSTVKLEKVEGNILHIAQADMLDGSPVIDIKPFFPRYDNRDNVTIGWLEKNKDMPVEELVSDGRFEK